MFFFGGGIISSEKKKTVKGEEVSFHSLINKFVSNFFLRLPQKSSTKKCASAAFRSNEQRLVNYGESPFDG